jgi:nitrate reductase gamma subunit
MSVFFEKFAAILLPMLALIIGYVLNVRSNVEQAKKANEEIKHAESRVEAEPEKAKPAWDLARATLESYFNRNLSQIASIFWLSVFVMIIGFGVIIVGVFEAMNTPSAVVPAALATAAGIITEFIGATFLFIYRSTIQQATDYSKTLERINSVGMAMQILDTMPDKTQGSDLKSKTKARLVELLVRQVYTSSAESISTRSKPQKKDRKETTGRRSGNHV